MGDLARQWGEKEWEGYANNLLSTHHSLFGGSYQRIPDIAGDNGLEGIADTGDAYQCYADQDTKTHKERVQKQKDKIKDDLEKLDINRAWWASFLGPRKIRRWTLMVPVVADKDVVAYGRKKGRELLAKKLPFIDAKFEVYVKSDQDFPNALLIAREPRLPKGSGKPATSTQIATFKDKNPQFIQYLDDKLRKVLDNQSDAKRGEYRDKLLRWHLDASNFIDDLHARFPTEWEELVALITRKGDSIEAENLLVRGPAHQRLAGVRRDFATTLGVAHQFLNEGDRELVSWGTVSKWLGECTLDFPDGCNA
jgi:hypothetical protein